MDTNISGVNEKPLGYIIKNVIIPNIEGQIKGIKLAKPYIQGKPGGGKTESILHFCKENGWNVFHIHLSLYPIEDISGLPIFENIEVNGEMLQGTKWSFPEVLTKIYEFSKEKKTVVLIDDFHLASQAHLALGFELFSEHKLRTYRIPENTAFIICGNNSIQAGKKSQNSAITNRLAVYPVYTDFTAWKTEFAIPNGINQSIITFLSKQNNKQFFHEDEDLSNPWGSPRSWTYLSNMLGLLNDDEDIHDYVIRGHVGKVAATEFIRYDKLYRNTNISKVFDGTEKINFPKRNDQQLEKYIYGMAAVNEFLNRIIENKNDKAKRKEISLIMAKIMKEISDNGNNEIVVIMSKEIIDYSVNLVPKDMSIYSNIYDAINDNFPGLKDIISTIIRNLASK